MFWRILNTLTAWAAIAAPVLAQTPVPVPRPQLLSAPAIAAPGAAPSAAPSVAPVVTPNAGTLSLQALYAGTGKPVANVEWRIYAVRQNDPVLVASSSEPRPAISLLPGEYVVHVTYGLAAATKRISMPAGGLAERITINAGGLVLRGQLADAPIAPERHAIAVYISSATDSEARLVTRALKSGEMIRLPEGPYHVVSTYAGSNSVVRSDILVPSGKVVEATVNHRAANVTLKLVRAAGGVALANTAWTVLTPGGDSIAEALGAFPTVELAEGEYDVIARHDGREYKDRLKVVSGVNRDYEVVLR